MSTDTHRFPLRSTVPNHAWAVFSKWYSRTGAERPKTISQGAFQDYAELWNDWYGEDKEEYKEDED